jgi:hypothetical protein
MEGTQPMNEPKIWGVWWTNGGIEQWTTEAPMTEHDAKAEALVIRAGTRPGRFEAKVRIERLALAEFAVNVAEAEERANVQKLPRRWSWWKAVDGSGDAHARRNDEVTDSFACGLEEVQLRMQVENNARPRCFACSMAILRFKPSEAYGRVQAHDTSLQCSHPRVHRSVCQACGKNVDKDFPRSEPDVPANPLDPLLPGWICSNGHFNGAAKGSGAPSENGHKVPRSTCRICDAAPAKDAIGLGRDILLRLICEIIAENLKLITALTEAQESGTSYVMRSQKAEGDLRRISVACGPGSDEPEGALAKVMLRMHEHAEMLETVRMLETMLSTRARWFRSDYTDADGTRYQWSTPAKDLDEAKKLAAASWPDMPLETIREFDPDKEDQVKDW